MLPGRRWNVAVEELALESGAEVVREIASHERGAVRRIAAQAERLAVGIVQRRVESAGDNEPCVVCTLVVASASNAAHDAYGKAFGLSSYATYSYHVRAKRYSGAGASAPLSRATLDRYIPAAPRRRALVFTESVRAEIH